MKKSKKEINKKFVLVGDGFCGKSTLIHSFYNRKFTDKYEPTIFDTFTVTTDIYKKNVRLEIMDTGGQNEFSRVRPLSYPEVDCIILCFSIDSRESSQNIIESWLPEIKHYVSNKIPIVLVGCKIDLRFDNSIIDNQFKLKQEHLNDQLDSKSHQLKNSQLSSPQLTIQQFNNSLNYGLFKTLALYCCRHGRQCTCYHSRICSTNCINLKRKVNQLSNSSSYLLKSTKQTATTTSNTSLLCKDNLIRCNRTLIDNKLRNSSNTEEDSNFSSSEDNEECMNMMNNSSLSLNCNLQDKNLLNNNYTNHYNNSIYRHNQSLLNTLIHQQVEYQLQQQQKQCRISLNNHSLNSSESDESELIETVINNTEDIELNDNNFKINSPVDHLESSTEEAKDQSNLIEKLNSNHLIKDYKNLTTTDDNNNRSLNKTNQNKINLELNKKDKRIFKNPSLKYKLSTILGVNHTNSTNTLNSSKSELKFTNLFQNRKLNSTSNTNLQFKSSSLIYKSKTDTKLNNFKNQFISQLITTEEGIKLRDKIGASAYVECSSRMNIGVDEVFKTALGLTLKHQLRFNLLDIFRSKK